MAKANDGSHLDMKGRFGTITGSAIPKIVSGLYGGDAEAVLGIFQVNLMSKQSLIYCAAGHKNEAPLANFYVRERAKEGVLVELSDAPFKRAADLPYIACTADRLVKDGTKDGGLLEAKFIAGYKNKEQLKIDDLLFRYKDQCQLEMRCWNRPYCALVVGNSVCKIWQHIPRSKAWWANAKHKLQLFYDTYLRWYWENSEHKAAVREIFEEENKVRAAEDRIDIEGIFARQADPALVRHMQQLRVPSNVQKN